MASGAKSLKKQKLIKSGLNTKKSSNLFSNFVRYKICATRHTVRVGRKESTSVLFGGQGRGKIRR